MDKKNQPKNKPKTMQPNVQPKPQDPKQKTTPPNWQKPEKE